MGKKTYIDAKTGKPVIDSEQNMVLTLKPEHYLIATCGEPGKCVVAQAVADLFAEDFVRVQVSRWMTKVETKTRIIRFKTPYSISNQIPEFDAKKGWKLGFGEFVFPPLSPTARIGARPNRRKVVHKKKTGGGQDKFNGTTIPRRVISRVSVLVATA